MDPGQIQLATSLVHVASIFGFTTNIIALLTVKLNKKLHTSFGIICTCLAANNCFVLILNSIWYLMPDSENYGVNSFLGRIVGMISLTSWTLGNRFHLFISSNRLFAIVSPFRSQKYMTTRNTMYIAVVIIISALVQCSPMITTDDLWFCYDRQTMRWSFPHTERGRFYEAYICDIPVTMELASILILDVVTLIYLKIVHVQKVNNLGVATTAEERAVEIRLFKQSFSQSIPLLVDFTCFAFVTPQLSEDFGRFLTTTLVWHLEHGFDGLIIDIFHTRFELFTGKNKTANSIALSSVLSSAYTSTA